MSCIRLSLALLVSAACICTPAALAQDKLPLPDFLSGQSIAAQNAPPKPQSLRFVTSLDFPPFNYLDNKGKLNGFNVYLARAICTELALENACTIEAAPFNELKGRLESGLADALIAGVSSTKESRKALDFTRAYLQFPARFVVSKTRTGKVPDFEGDLEGIRIGAVSGSPHEKMARAFFSKAQITGYANENLLFADLRAGKEDLAFSDAMRLSFWLNGTASGGCCSFAGGAYYSQDFLGEGMRIAVASRRPELADSLDGVLRSLQKKGVIAELYLRFFPTGFY